MRPTPVFAGNSPVPQTTTARDAWHRAEAYVATHPEAEIVVGSGDSMLPLYRPHTVLVLERQNLDALKAGMTVVFIGSGGEPIAHALVEKTARGWKTAGLGNREEDATLMTFRNYVGTAVLAYTPVKTMPVSGLLVANATVPGGWRSGTPQ